MTARDRARRPVRVHRHAAGPRVYLAGWRVHHGPPAILAAAALGTLAGRRRSRMAAVAALAAATLAAHDARDFPWRDGDNHGRDGRPCA